MWILTIILGIIAVVLYAMNISQSVKSVTSGCGSCPKKGNNLE